MNNEEAAQLLDVLTCLIDTAARTTDLENVYDDTNDKHVSWGQVRESHRVLITQIIIWRTT